MWHDVLMLKAQPSFHGWNSESHEVIQGGWLEHILLLFFSSYIMNTGVYSLKKKLKD